MENQNYQRELEQIRREIDQVDSELLPLFLRRMQCAERVAQVKRQHHMPVLNPQREQEILDRVKAQAGAYGSSAQALYAAMMAVSRERQHQLLESGGPLRALVQEAPSALSQPNGGVMCQGVEGAYAHMAAKAFFGEQSFSFQPTWKEVFEGVKNQQAEYGVVPVENSFAGSVTDVMDLLLSYRFYIVGAVGLKVEHCLALPPGRKELRRVLSHPQGLAQCSNYLTAHGLEGVESSNTAAAAKAVAQEKPEATGAICSKEAAEKYGLEILETGIQNVKNNRTRFVVISRTPVLPAEATKISLCFSLPHVTGSLSRVLERFALQGLNLTKIESRPLPGSTFEYDFYLDFTGNLRDETALNLICALQEELPRFSFLGNYPELNQGSSSVVAVVQGHPKEEKGQERNMEHGNQAAAGKNAPADPSLM